MTNAQKYFLIAAEEQSINKAAKKAFISQQCLSSHIKKLEETYGVYLFNRRPHLSLTPAGKELAHTLKTISFLEDSLTRTLKDIDSGINGHIRVGIHSSRAQVILPQVLTEFYAKYPMTKVSIIYTTTRYLESMLSNGLIDMFIGFYPNALPELVSVPLMDEKIYYVISDNLIKKYFPVAFPQCIERFRQGIDLRNFEKIPLINFDEYSIFNLIINNFFAQQAIYPNIILETNDSELHALLASNDVAACFCRSMMIDLFSSSPKHYTGYNNLNIFPIKDLDYTHHVSLVYRKQTNFPSYFYAFIELVQNHPLFKKPPEMQTF